MIIPLIAIAAVFVLIAIRQVGNVRIPMWVAMSLGAAAVLATGQISIPAAISAINFQVIFLLLGMFLIGEGLRQSNYLVNLFYNSFEGIQSKSTLLLVIIFGAGIISAFIVNDPFVIIATPLIMTVSRKHNIDYKPLLLALAFSVTIGSAMSPIGNPQNILIAASGAISTPLVKFFQYLLIPTLISLYVVYLAIRFFFKGHFSGNVDITEKERIADKELATLCKFSLSVFIALIAVNVAIELFTHGPGIPLGDIGLVSALPMFILSKRRFELAKGVNWSILIFFASMFILVQSVWSTGFFQSLITQFGLNLSQPGPIFVIRLVVSQFISNVPLVALYLPILSSLGAKAISYLALAAASTIAGNLYVLGAASNIIIIDESEKKYGKTITPVEFSKIGIVVTLASALVYYLFIYVL